MKRILLFIIIIVCLSCGVTARERTDSLLPSAPAGGNLTVSLITCAPGPDVYELCGHSAIRIRNERMDSVWNYGIFDFDTPNFIYRFCKGETDYMVCGYPFEFFMPSYVRRGSQVKEQVLNLTQEEASKLLEILQIESLPQNRTYRYNYVKDNCATRPWLRIKEAVEKAGEDSPGSEDNPIQLAKIEIRDSLYFPTFRSEMRYFHKNYPWYQFGIDLALGSGIDRKLNPDEDIFAPPVLADKLADAIITRAVSDSLQHIRPVSNHLSGATNILYPGVPDATLAPTPWYAGPTAVASLMLLLSFMAMIAIRRRRCILFAKLWICIYFLAAGFGGCVIAFLVFVSSHEATSPNILILWLNPLQWIAAIGVWIPSWRKAVRGLARYDMTLAVLALLFSIAGMIGIIENFSIRYGQLANPAILIMALCLIPLSAALLKITARPRRTEPDILIVNHKKR